jgi:alpha-galactosidase/6-phospho-beta-glucosidase family protein
MFSSPVTLLVRLASMAFPQLHVAGICELPFTTLQSICAATGADFESVDYSYIGINHLGWFHSVRNGSKDLLPAYAATRPSGSKKASAVEFPSRELVESLNAIPLKYLRLQYQPCEVLAQQTQELRSRGQILQEIQNRAITVFQESGMDEILGALAWRPADWYKQSVGPLLLALAGEPVRAHIFLSSRVEEPFGPFEAGDVEERAYVVRDGLLQPRARSGPPRALADLLARFAESDRVAARAVLERSPELLIHSLRLHPWTAKHPSLNGIAERIIQNA